MYNEQDDMDFLNSILDDEDVIDDWSLWKSDDGLVLWLVEEKLTRGYYENP